MLADTSAQPAYAYLALSAALFGVWLVLYLAWGTVRREMVRVSLGTMPLGLTEPLFVPEYWNPPTLWNLARRTGFDLESLLFSFAIGGIVFAAYHRIVSYSEFKTLVKKGKVSNLVLDEQTIEKEVVDRDGPAPLLAEAQS